MNETLIKVPVSEATNEDCMEMMARYPDKFFELAIVDPPYGLGNRLSDGGGKLMQTPMAKLYRESSQWDIVPPKEYWQELFRVSKNQAVFGANYFLEHLGNTRGFVTWDKLNDLPTMSACELVWTSLDKPAKLMKMNSMDLNRFHPTQKPTYVYRFIYQYCNAKQGDKILDTHLGSQSSRIAAYDLGFDFYGCELDPDYFRDGCTRFEQHKKQLKLF